MAADDDALLDLIEACLERMERDGHAGLTAFCAEHPAHAAAIRERVAMLADAGLLEERSALLSGDAHDERAFPERLGEFRLIRRLGGGGMGVVYLAEQERLQRQVALKLIRPEHLYFPGARERFRREVEAVARLQHAGIVPVYTFGEEGGIPYFAMERVPGVSLAQVITAVAGRDPATLTGRDLRSIVLRGATDAVTSTDARDSASASAAPGSGAGKVPGDRVRDSGSGEQATRLFGASWVAACLRIVRSVCEALDHAHERGVLHRDIKPSNIMLTPDGRVLLLDFGLALAEGSQRMTVSGSQLGSLAYMSPEQVRGAPVDARSDLYALGVTLYELLTLHAPYVADTTDETRRLILDGRAAPLRDFNAAVPRDAETVCLTAMERDAPRRYASAPALGEELARVLELRPIEARRAGTLVALRRWTQRHPAGTVALLLGGLLLVGGPAAYIVQQNAANKRISAALARAEANFARARQAVDTMLTQLGEETLDGVPQMEDARRELLEKALLLYQDFLAERGDDVELQLAAAAAGGRVAQLQLQLGRLDAARAAWSEALAACDALAARAPEDLAVIAARADLGNAGLAILLALGDGPAVQAEADATQATVTRWLEREPDSPSALAAAAHVEQVLTSFHAKEGRIEEALAAARRGHALWTRLLALTPDDLDALDGVGSADNDLGHLYAELERVADAEAAYRRAIATYEHRATLTSSQRAVQLDLSVTRAKLATLLLSLGRGAEAEAEFRAAVSIDESLRAQFPGYLAHQSGLGISTSNLALMLLDAGRPDEAEPLLRRSVEAWDRALALSPDAPEVLAYRSSAFVNLARLHRERGDWATARTELTEAVACLRRSCALEPGRPEWRDYLRNAVWALAEADIHLGDHVAACAHAEELPVLNPDSGADWRIASALVSQCIAPAAADPALDETARAARAAACRARSLALLRGAIERGFSNAKGLARTPDMVAIRDDPEFQQILADLKTRLAQAAADAPAAPPEDQAVIR